LLRWYAFWFWLSCETTAPPPKAASAEQRDQNHAYDGHPDGPTNCQFGNQEENEQKDYAGDYEDCGETHFKSMVSDQWSVTSKQD
jgi:hypothetical protein